MKKILPICLLFIVAFIGCEKKEDCNVTASLESTSLKPTIGDDVSITLEGVGNNGGFRWSTPKINRPSVSNVHTINDIKLSDRGWYYCVADYSACDGTFADSIFIDVQLVQEAPPCTLSKNILSGTGIPQTTVTNTFKQLRHATYGGLTIDATGAFGQPPYTIAFNPHLNGQLPPEGTYTTTAVAAFNELDELNIISVSFVNSSTYYHAHVGQKVYVKHVGGKLQISFCSLNFGGAYVSPVKVSGQIQEL